MPALALCRRCLPRRIVGKHALQAAAEYFREAHLIVAGDPLRFVRDCSELWNVPIVWVEYRPGRAWVRVDFMTASRNGQPFEALIRERNYLPNPVARFA